MGSLVDDQLFSAINVILNEDLALAQSIIEKDKKINKFDLKVTKICQKILALNQPVAADLRLVIAALNINNNLERIGDISVNLIENFLLIKKKPDFFQRSKFGEMADTVLDMVKDTLDSFIGNDQSLAKKVIQMDVFLDRLNIDNHQILINVMKENPNNIESALALVVICRQLERIGDHATNIAEDVYFINTAETLRHNYNEFLNSDVDEEDDD